MKKLLALACVLSLFLGIFAGCKNREDERVKVLYKQFIAGEITAIDEDGTEKPFSNYLLGDLEKQGYRYTFLDMTGDGVVELCVQQMLNLHFFTVKDEEIYLWYTEGSMYVHLLNNGALMFERHGGAPTHINYEYYELDKNAHVKFKVTFSCWDGQSIEEGKVYPDEYFFNDEKVTKEEYEAKTKKYLEIGSDKLVWYDMEKREPKQNSVETLSEKLIREIDGAYDEEMKSPEDSSTAGMCAISEKYTKKWQDVADEYYKKLTEYDITKINETSYCSADEFHTFIKNMKTSWEKDNAVQCENYEKTLYAIYGGSIVNTLAADYKYNEQMNWALKLVKIYEHLG